MMFGLRSLCVFALWLAFVLNVQAQSVTATLSVTFTNPNPSAFRNLGNSLASLGPDRVLVGALPESNIFIHEGAVFLFHTNGTLLTTFTNPAAIDSAYFGHQVAVLSPNQILISAFHFISTSNEGAVYLFNTNGQHLRTFTSPNPIPGDQFGAALAVVGKDRVVIGASGVALTNGIPAAYLFNIHGKLLATFAHPNPDSGMTANSIAVVGSDRVLIGAPNYNNNSGGAFLFDLRGRLITTITNPSPPASGFPGFFGYPVAGGGPGQTVDWGHP